MMETAVSIRELDTNHHYFQVRSGGVIFMKSKIMNLSVLIILLFSSVFLVSCANSTDESNSDKPSVDFSAISLFQVIEIPILDESGVILVEDRTIPIVSDRGARLVVYLDAPENWKTSTVEVRVEVINNGKSDAFSSDFVLNADSVIGDPNSAVQIDLPKEVVQTTSTYNISLWQTGESTASAKIPETGNLELGAISTGSIKIHLVPYSVDNFTPKTTPDIVAGYRDAVFAIYPTSEVIITVGDVRPFWTNDVDEVVVDVGVVQETSNLPSDVYFFGLVSGVARREEFDGSTGTSEEGGMAVPDRAYFASGAAFGDDLSESTLIHELGHLHMLLHAPDPNGNPPDADPLFPDPQGLIGTLGFDSRTNEFIDPGTFDMMGYSQPRWISEYHYQKLVNHVLLSQTWE